MLSENDFISTAYQGPLPQVFQPTTTEPQFQNRLEATFFRKSRKWVAPGGKRWCAGLLCSAGVPAFTEAWLSDGLFRSANWSDPKVEQGVIAGDKRPQITPGRKHGERLLLIALGAAPKSADSGDCRHIQLDLDIEYDAKRTALSTISVVGRETAPNFAIAYMRLTGHIQTWWKGRLQRAPYARPSACRLPYKAVTNFTNSWHKQILNTDEMKRLQKGMDGS